MAPTLTASCVWRVTPELLIALDERLGEPLDTYVNGSQVWMTDDGPGEVVLEWRLHPVPSYKRPPGLATEDVFAATALALANNEPTAAPIDRLWEGLECFPAYVGGVEPATLARAAATAIGRDPDAYGLVDHEVIADVWERSKGATSIVTALLAQLKP